MEASAYNFRLLVDLLGWRPHIGKCLKLVFWALLGAYPLKGPFEAMCHHHQPLDPCLIEISPSLRGPMYLIIAQVSLITLFYCNLLEVSC